MDKNIFRQIEESLECAMGRGQIIDRDALNFVRGLQIQVPFYVAEWYEDMTSKYPLYSIVDDLFHLRTSHKIFDWFLVANQLHTPDDVTRFLVYMQTFGYTVTEDTKYIVRVTVGYGSGDCYVAYNNELKVYYLTIDSLEAVQLSFDIAEKIAVLFKMDYELIEV